VLDVQVGGTFGVAVDTRGIAWAWGDNSAGELGTGDTDSRAPLYPILNLKGKTVSQVACGDQFVVSLGSTVRKEMPGQPKQKKTQRKEKAKRGVSRKRSDSRQAQENQPPSLREAVGKQLKTGQDNNKSS